MCGIAGWVGGPHPVVRLDKMVQSLRHRGPDETGFWSSECVGLGIARLSIVDVHGGQQPVSTADGAIRAVFNGEIYNYRELAKDLTVRGFTLRSNSDSEILPHLYEVWGIDFVKMLRGMFAIALWDNRTCQLVLARDRVGKKPLYYLPTSDGLMFASEVRAFLATGWSGPVNLGAIDHTLAFGYPPIDTGVMSGIRSVLPGSVAVWSQGQLKQQKYWAWSPVHQRVRVSKDAVLEQVESTLDEAVRVRLVSERPVGAFLSGGVDSTIVTALMARHYKGSVKTFSIGFKDPLYDESEFARGIANYLGTEHTELIVDPDPVTLLSSIADAFDQPFPDSSALPSLLLSDLASREVVVALSGDGGDEAFAGYLRYLLASRLQSVNPVLAALAPLTPIAGRAAKAAGARRMARLVRELRSEPNLGVRYQHLMEWMPTAFRRKLWTAEALASIDPQAPGQRFQEFWNRLEYDSPFTQMRAMDIATYLPGDLLPKVDISSMAHSLEVRSPFLDQEVLALAGQIPPTYLVRGRTNKWILRQLAYKLVPRSLVDRPKRGFGIPRAAWLRGPLREASHDYLLDDTARQRNWWRPEVVSELLKTHSGGEDRDVYLWPMLMTEIWARRWCDARSLQ